MARLTTRFVQTAPPGRHGDGDGNGILRSGPCDGPRSPRLGRSPGRITGWHGGASTPRHSGPAGTSPPPPTFAEGVEAVLALQRPNWRDGGKSEKQWRASLDTYAVALMSKPVSDITAHDVLAVVGPVWNDKRERRRGGGCFNASARCSGGPWPMDIGPTLRSRPCGRRSRRMAFTGRALAHGEVGAALATIRESQAWPSTRLALEFVALTVARSGEVRGARWEEVDLEAATWTVPADRMKASRPHRVPALRRRRGRPGGRPGALRRRPPRTLLVFPSQRGPGRCLTPPWASS